MPYTASLVVCEEKARNNDWVNKVPDQGSKECVASVKALCNGIPQTTQWRRGKKVKGNSISPGTATFPRKVGDTFLFSGHAAIFVRDTGSGIEVYDQWKPSTLNPAGKRFSKRVIRYKCSGHVSDDGEAFFVVEPLQVNSNEPALCSSLSTY